MKKLLGFLLGIILLTGCTKDDKAELPIVATEFPIITTNELSNITTTTATSGGSITYDGGGIITAKGVVWSTQSNPTIELTTKTNDLTGTSSFTSSIIGLNVSTKYYVRAYATNSVGTAYGTELSFYTSDLVVPASPENLIGEIIIPSAIQLSWTDRSTNETKFVIERKLVNGTFEVVGNTNPNYDSFYDYGITGPVLSPTDNTTYIYRVYASNGAGNSLTYSNELTITIKPTIIIGTQTWTNKNLDVATYSDGTPIPQVTNQSEWVKLTTGAWCYYDNKTPYNSTIRGKLYNRYAVEGIWNEASKTDSSQRKKLAPPGYHVPSDLEWTTLINYLGGNIVAGDKMKALTPFDWNYPTKTATNSSGFSALPGGSRNNNGTFYNIDDYSTWWSSTASPYDLNYGISYTLGGYNGNIGRYWQYSNVEGYSVRCVKD